MAPLKSFDQLPANENESGDPSQDLPQESGVGSEDLAGLIGQLIDSNDRVEQAQLLSEIKDIFKVRYNEQSKSRTLTPDEAGKLIIEIDQEIEFILNDIETERKGQNKPDLISKLFTIEKDLQSYKDKFQKKISKPKAKKTKTADPAADLNNDTQNPTPESEKQSENVEVNTFADFKLFIENAETQPITQETEEAVFNQIVKVLEGYVFQAKLPKDITSLTEAADSIESIWSTTLEKLKPGITSNPATKNLLQNLCGKFKSIKASLIQSKLELEKELDRAQKEKKTQTETIQKIVSVEGVVSFVENDIDSKKITKKIAIEIARDIKEVIQKKLKETINLDEAEIRKFANTLYDLEENLDKKLSSINNPDVIRLGETILANLEPVFSTINKTLKIEPAAAKQPKTPDNQPHKAEQKKPEDVVLPNYRTLKGAENAMPQILDLLKADESKAKDTIGRFKNTLQREFELLAIPNVPKEKLIQAQEISLRIKEFLDNVEVKNKEVENAVNDFLNSITSFYTAIEKIINPTTKEEDKKPVDTPAAPNPSPAAPKDTTPNIEDMFRQDPYGTTEIPPEIKKDKKFIAWLESIHKQKYNDTPRTVAEWHEAYTEQREKVSKLEAIYRDPTVANEVFKDFPEKGERELAIRKQIEAFEFSLLTDSRGDEKANKVIESYEKTQAQREVIKKLEEEKKVLETGYKSKNFTLPAELVLRATQGVNYERENLQGFERFLSDMETNYDYYSKPLKGKQQEGEELAEMFKRYSKTSPKGSSDEEPGKVSRFSKFVYGLKNNILTRPFITDNSDYHDKTEFKAKVKALQSAGLVKSGRVSREAAEEKMNKLITLSQDIFDATREFNTSIQEVLKLVPEGDEKDLFIKVFKEYLQIVGSNGRLQESAKQKGVKDELFAGIDTQLEASAQDKKQLEQELVQDADGDMWERNDFNLMVKQELIGEKLDTILRALDTKSLSIKDLAKIQADFAEIDPNIADELAYRRTLLKISKTEISFISRNKEISIAPESRKKYDLVFENDEITPAEKLKYVETILTMVKEKLAKQNNNILEQLELKQAIKYFEDKKADIK